MGLLDALQGNTGTIPGQGGTGLLDLLLGKSNPVSQFADTRQNFLSTVGAGLLAGPTVGQGLASVAGQLPQARALDQQAQQKTRETSASYQMLVKQFPDLAAYVQQGGDMSTAVSEAFKRQDEANKQTVLSGGDTVYQNGKPLYTAPFKPNNPTNLRAGVGQPFFAKNLKTGRVEPWQSMTDGSAVNLANPQANPSDYNFDPAITAQQRASGSAEGKVQGAADATLPIAAQTAQNALDTIAKLRANKQGQDDTFGTYGIGPLQIPDKFGITVPQSPKADFRAMLDQAGGQAFLQAYSTLRGAGAISDAEGQKAGAAISRMTNPDISKEAFNAALDDYEAVIRAGYGRLQQQAQQSPLADPTTAPQLSAPAAGAPAAPAPGGGGPVDYRTYFGGQ